ncbi:MAG: TIGR04282 family arsenosugar biosynthesis glycosyltransferase [Chitinophagaceae bacterium]|nr:TIGR04282 family arsenosugar biosynthesis glycosyltransferase [Chitinophagaceae bacterium]
MKNKNILIIFVKNAIEGKVKTRLAHSIGNKNALKIYRILLEKTKNIVENIFCDKVVYYSDFIEKEDIFLLPIYTKKLQNGKTLGERMRNAIQNEFLQGYEKVCIIGSDCYDLDSLTVEEAFLREEDFVLGPAYDGGYYLLGMRFFFKDIFENIQWSTETVLHTTLDIINTGGHSYSLLPPLSDVDEEKDMNLFLKSQLE